MAAKAEKRRLGDEAEQAYYFGDAVPRDVPRDGRLNQSQFLTEQLLHFQPALADRCERTGRA